MNESMRKLEKRSRAAFDASVEAQDGATRSRLARARAAALEGLSHRRISGPALWVPAGAAAAAVVAALLWQREDDAAPGPPRASAIALEDLDIVAGGEDFDMLAADEGFYDWADEQISGDVG